MTPAAKAALDYLSDFVDLPADKEAEIAEGLVDFIAPHMPREDVEVDA